MSVERRGVGPLFWLVPLFFVSGISGLVYQTVWLRMMIRALGVTVYAVTIVVAVFMTGLALGALVGGRVGRGSRGLTPLRLYGLIEVVIGVFGALSTKLMLALPLLFRALAAAPGSGGRANVLRMGLAALVLLPPTVLMGATLPILTGLSTRDGSAGRRAGLLYGVNTLGAVFGVLSTGFFLIALLGEVGTVLTAAGLNVAVGLVAFALAGAVPPAPPEPAPRAEPAAGDIARKVIVVAAASGFCALALEVIWARLLSLLLGNSVYGFSAMLGAYLFGLGAGSLIMARWLDRLRRPLLALALLELAGAILAVVSIIAFTELGLGDHDQRYTYALLWSLGDFGRLFAFSWLIVLPVTLVYGGIFPLASRLVAPPGARPEAAIGRLYAVNTVGGILGSLVGGLVLIPALGTLRALLVVALGVFGIGLYLLRLASQKEDRARTGQIGIAAGLIFVTAAISVSFEDPFLAVLVARLRVAPGTPILQREDPGATVISISRRQGGSRLFINGLWVSETSPWVGELLINFPLVFNPEPGPKRILDVGLGVGEALRYGVDHGHRITIAELHPAVVDTFKLQNPDGARYLTSEGSGVVIEDGRNFLLRTEERFDSVLVDGSPPLYASGMANLYSVEFMKLVKDHLRPNGVFAVWFPVVCFERDFWNVFRSFSDTFPWVALQSEPGGSNAIILGSASASDPFTIDHAEFASRYAALASKAASKLPNLEELWASSRYDATALRARAAEFPPVTDDRPHTEFPLQAFLRGEPYLRDNRFLRFAFLGDAGPHSFR